ncbi:MAG: peptidylprolyl isomerase [Acidimicrobiia bacterium]
MRRFQLSVSLVVAAVLLVSCSSSSSSSGAGPSTLSGPGFSVDSTKVSAATLASQLRVIAANQAFAKVLKREDDTVLAPKPDTIDPTVAQAWIDTSVNQVIGDREFRRRGLKVTPKLLREAKTRVEKVWRGRAVFDAFPKSFQTFLIGRQARMDALEASFPKTHEPTEADLVALWPAVQQTCQEGKLVSQIFVDTKEQADAVETALAGGADFGELARQRSTDTTTAARGGVSMCIGSVRFNASEDAIQQAVKAMPIGAVSAPIKNGDGYVVVKNLPLTFENAHSLLIDDWHGRHPTALYDFLNGARLAADITVSKHFASSVGKNAEGLAIVSSLKPVTL